MSTLKVTTAGMTRLGTAGVYDGNETKATTCRHKWRNGDQLGCSTNFSCNIIYRGGALCSLYILYIIYYRLKNHSYLGRLPSVWKSVDVVVNLALVDCPSLFPPLLLVPP